MTTTTRYVDTHEGTTIVLEGDDAIIDPAKTDALVRHVERACCTGSRVYPLPQGWTAYTIPTEERPE